MSSNPSDASPSQRPQWLSKRYLPWILVAAAFLLGLLLFALVLKGDRDDGFFRAGDEARPSAGGQVFEPLPTPDAAGGSSVERGLPPDAPSERETHERSADGERELPSLDGTPASVPESSAPPPTASAPNAGGATTSARPIRSPRPDYPRRSLRRGESGTVLLQVQVDASGRPVSVDVVQSSRSSGLDRAAVQAVERWEFSPALRAGQPVASKVLIPIEFTR